MESRKGWHDSESVTAFGRELRLVTRKPHVQVNYAAVLGGTFTWQELTTGADGAANEAKSGYYFMPLGT